MQRDALLRDTNRRRDLYGLPPLPPARDPLRSARGILTASVLGAALWAALAVLLVIFASSASAQAGRSLDERATEQGRPLYPSRAAPQPVDRSPQAGDPILGHSRREGYGLIQGPQTPKARDAQEEQERHRSPIRQQRRPGQGSGL